MAYGPAPAYYAHASFPNNRNGVVYVGDEPPLIHLDQDAATHYDVVDLFGNVVYSADRTASLAPTLGGHNDLALAVISWWNGTAIQDISPTFLPGPVGTNVFDELLTPDFAVGSAWRLSTQHLQMANDVPISFETQLGANAGWFGRIDFVRSAAGHNAAVVQTVIGKASSDMAGVAATATVAATAPGSLLFAYVTCGGGSSPVVTDNTGNTWVELHHSNTFAGSIYLFTTLAPSPASITSLTASLTGGSATMFAFYEISGADNTSPIDAGFPDVDGQFGNQFGNNYSASALVQIGLLPAADIQIGEPDGGYLPGWYRVKFSGPITNDTYFGPAYAATNICFIRRNANFPDMPAPSILDASDGSLNDPVTPCVLGVGPMRASLGNVLSPHGTAGDSNSIEDALAVAADAKTYWLNITNPNRPRYQHLAFPGQTVDELQIPGGGPGNICTLVYNRGTFDSSKIYVQVTAGTAVGTSKMQVFYPDAVTVVETYDDVLDVDDAAARINAASAYIFMVPDLGGGRAFQPTAVLGPIGNAYFNGVVEVVQAVYDPAGITHFEGPSNEPSINVALPFSTQAFANAVHAGNPNAKAIGPCPVEIFGLASWDAFFAAGGASNLDAISFHDYGLLSGPANASFDLRSYIEAFLAVIAKHGLEALPLWQTEATWCIVDQYGTFHPRRASVPLVQVMFWEQYGVPREQNPYWYLVSHGFWEFAAFLVCSDGSLQPQCVLYRTLAEETWGMGYTERLHFGDNLGDHLFLGNVYTATDTSGCVVLVTAGTIPNATVTLTISGTSAPLTCVDGQGRLSEVPIYNGHARVPVGEFPTYVRLPIGVTVTGVYTCNDWPAIQVRGQGTSSSPFSNATIGQVGVPIGEGNWGNRYPVQLIPPTSPTAEQGFSSPVQATVLFDNSTRFDRLVIQCPLWYSLNSTLVKFDVQTTIDGSTWTTQTTIDQTAAFTSSRWGSDSENEFTNRDYYGPGQYIFDIKMPAPIVVTGVRLNVHTVTYGGEPDAGAAGSDPAYPQDGPGSNINYMQLCLAEIAVLCDDDTRPQVVL